MDTRTFSDSPSTLPLLLRAGAALVPGASRLPFVAGGGGELPDLTLERGGVAIDQDKLAAYCRVCGFSLRDELPTTFPHVLAFPLHLSLLTDGRFPFPAVGLVHIANTITQHRPIRSSETLSLRVSAGRLSSHPKGRQFSLLTEVRAGGELVWEEESVNLKRGGGSGEGKREREPLPDELPSVSEWSLPGDLGRRYAAVSGDRNPIHISSVTAKLFGFPSAIAHGMWTKARCLAALEGRLPERFEVSVSFRKPIMLPAKVAFAEAGERFAVRDVRKGTPHLDGTVQVNEAGS
jgi:acyl dehydratase